MTLQTFREFLKGKNILFAETSNQNGGMIFIIEHSIPSGKYCGKTVEIGIPVPADFPDAAPYGLHVKKNHNFEETIQSKNTSVLGEEWEFWSRQINWDNPARRTPQYFFDHVNRWLEIV